MQHGVVRWVATAIIIVVSFVWSQSVLAQADQFDFEVDFVEYDGAGHGPYDGTVDMTDHFNDFSHWTNSLGTTTVAGGVLHLESPGTLVPVGPLQLYRSEVVESPSRQLKETDGFLVRSYWIITPEDLVTGMSFAQNISNGQDSLVVGVLNWNETEANFIGIEPGLSAILAHTNTGQAGFVVTAVPLTPGQFSGNVIMEFTHAPGTEAISARISVDNGVTYIDFGSKPYFLSVNAATLILYGDPLDGADVTPTPVETCPPPEPTPTPQPFTLDAYNCYKAKSIAPAFEREDVSMSDALVPNQTIRLKKPSHICFPGNMNGGGVSHPMPLLCCYTSRGDALGTQPSSLQLQGTKTGQVFGVQLMKSKIACEPCSLAP